MAPEPGRPHARCQGQLSDLAASLDVTPVNLPTRGLGIVVGAHWYPARLGRMTLGIGGELMTSRGSRTQEPATEGGADGPTVNTRLSAVSPQVSFNFGGPEGWSYISGGIGWANFTTAREDLPVADPSSRPKTINYGGGARWFSKKHVALSVDMRFYAINPQDATTARPAFPRMRLLVFSVGAGFK
ncbi:MAG: hypothetical protein LC804_07155 [Acidobacteria bacterium]|nr:hypothetical protein [Acidobacteriota bacterium]